MPEAAVVHAMHQMSMEWLEAHLRVFLGAFFDGPDEYRARYGEPLMRRRHLPVYHRSAQRDAWLACMQRALDDVAADPTPRRETHARISAFASTCAINHQALICLRRWPRAERGVFDIRVI
ncbi:MAG: globin domain-containing protein [Metallibacterium sp.]